MLDQTETACVLAGMAAIGAIYMSQNHSPFASEATQCSTGSLISNRGVSARAASVAVDVVPEPSDTDIWQDNFPQPSEDFEQHFPKHRRPGGGAHTMATKEARQAVKTQLNLETKNTKTTGMSVLIPGRSVTDSAELPKVTGGCMFNMSTAYEQRLMDAE